jgi:predicted extracellular nuclease
MAPATLTAQTAAGACSGSIQVSLDSFANCIALSAASASMSVGNTVATLTPAPGLLVNRNYAVRVTTAAQNATSLPLMAQYTSAGFTTVNPLAMGLSGVVISQIHGGGGNSGATYKNDFIELHNRGTVAVDLTGWSVQYASSTGSSWTVTALTGTTLQPGAFYLIQEGAGSGSQPNLPTPDASGTIAMSGTGGKVALVNTTTALSGTCPTGAQIVDLVGFGSSANCFEGSGPTPAPSNTLGVLRSLAGCTDTADNATDFLAQPVNPRNTASAEQSCSPAQNESGNALEADYCTTQFPLSFNVTAGSSQSAFGQIYETGVTETAGANGSVLAQFGYGPPSVNPQYEYGWKWLSTTYNVQSGNNDEYQATFNAPVAGSYLYGFRFSLDGGASWTYCDNNQGDSGAGSNNGLLFNLTDLGSMTSN